MPSALRLFTAAAVSPLLAAVFVPSAAADEAVVKVAELTAGSEAIGGPAETSWRARADVLVTDGAGNPVRGAVVRAVWAPTPGASDNGGERRVSCVTGTDGTCELRRTIIDAAKDHLAITGVRYRTARYDEEASATSAVAVQPAELAEPVRVMQWNIFHGGRNEGLGGEVNLAQLLEFVQTRRPDVLATVETYGSGDRILDALNEVAPAGVEYTGTKITQREPGQGGDNLWIFSRYGIEKVYPPVEAPGIDSFNFGGLRLTLDSGRSVDVFDTWLNWISDPEYVMEREAQAIDEGRERPYGDESLASSDLSTIRYYPDGKVTTVPEPESRMQQMQAVLDDAIPGYVGEAGSDVPAVLAGDLNASSHLDWTAEFADAPGHRGMVIDWPVTRAVEDDGWTDTYRSLHPDVAEHPGATWTPIERLRVPRRIDFTFVKGRGVDVRGADIVDAKLPRHADQHAFYSDHAAQITDLSFHH
ncbi:endonuclease/exonuclease/phosphatase family protein [Murinocardiopsis flavida]|uniref:Endonuclease/exonuclease/phosphatase family protein n=1 Tax=Murinocardiopsis flavida TaxID=645275 RepID=A0A2P8DRN9_9ACTN|nr:endonuclease/exonuclease/phosphatase family protein [Murinocardiopsis flavida]PSK99877.1 endonuclease/exonuclease/phosphatase family protein [Murinocardiopsis flavida]